MLSRRVLRAKAMQNLYSYFQSNWSNYQLAVDWIKKHYEEEFQIHGGDLEANRALRSSTIETFHQSFEQSKWYRDLDSEVQETVNGARDYFFKSVANDKVHFKKTMLAQVENIYEYYLLVLTLLVELADFQKRIGSERKDKQTKTGRVTSDQSLKFYSNQVIQKLRDNKRLEHESIRKNINWASKTSTVRKLYKEVLLKDEFFLSSEDIEKSNFTQDLELIDHLVRKVLFKNDIFLDYMDQQDMYWVDNAPIVRSLALKTLKLIDEKEPMSELVELSYNWEEDKKYFEDLYECTVSHDQEYEELIASKTQNWDIERIALVDKVIMKMAICEMVNFPSIPVKVTINEFVELSKQYSTPKSKQFVNGILDVIADELSSNKKIKKSGRGLIDNQ